MMVFAGSTPLGNLFTGELAHLCGAPVALLAGAGLSMSAAVAGWLLRAPAEKSLAGTLPAPQTGSLGPASSKTTNPTETNLAELASASTSRIMSAHDAKM